MKKLILLIAIFITGCSCSTEDEIKYTRSNSEATLVIIHRNCGNFLKVEIKNAEEARKYKERLQKLIREIEKYEDDVRVMEKN